MHKSDNPVSQLNTAQQQAINHQAGPVLVVAGAGTGKTRVIVERFCRLVQQGTPPDRVLALTFTEKAASEMRDRITEALGHYEVTIPVSTFNAFGEELLRQYAADVGLSRNFMVLSESAQIVFLQEHLDSLELAYFAPVSNPYSLLGDIASYFSLLKQHVITPQVYALFVASMPASDATEKLEKRKHQELATAYKNYLSAMVTAQAVDYDDQLFGVIQLLRKRPNVLREIQARYDYVMVDEFQDTNVMQSVLVDMLVGSQQNLFVVGDDDQSIYGWRGATLSNILDFKKRYPEATDISLIKNYRSTQEILDLSYRLVQHNNPDRLEPMLAIDKHLQAISHGPTPMVKTFQMLEEELQWIVEDIEQRIADGIRPGAIAVLARRNATLERLQKHLDAAHIPFSLAGQRYNIYQETAVKNLLEALTTVVDPDNSLSLYHTLSGPLFNLPAQELSQLLRLSRQNHASLWTTIETTTDKRFSAHAAALQSIVRWQQKASTLSVGQLAYLILDESGYKTELYTAAQTDPSVATTVMRLSELFQTLKDFERIAIVPSAVQYLQALPALIAGSGSGEDDTLDLSGDSVNVLTIHKAKGLEWETVYIADCTEGSFPLRQQVRGIQAPVGLISTSVSGADRHLAEERRLMYVAMTRAKQTLTLSHALQHTTTTTRKPSRFLVEAFGEQPLSMTSAKQSTLQLEIYTPSAPQQLALSSKMLQGEELTLSVSQVQSYITCPLDFYYCYVLHIPREDETALVYGSLLHQLVETTNKSLLAGNLIPLPELEKQLQEAWVATGFISKAQQTRALQQATTSLKNFYRRIKQAPRVPLHVEESFRIVLPAIKLTLNGRFDAVFPLGDSVEIVDYKTGTSVTDATKARARAAASQQLTLYALAWQHEHQQLPALVSLDFLETGQRGSLKKTARGVDSMLQKLETVANGIRQHDFHPGTNHLFCVHPPV